MLKTNSKKVREAVRAYIVRNTNGWEKDPETFEEAAAIIKRAWDGYKYQGMRQEFKNNIVEAFKDFAACLPNNAFDYIAEGDTVKLIGDMLEQTEQERSKYTDSQACDLLTYLIYSEVSKVAEIDF